MTKFITTLAATFLTSTLMLTQAYAGELSGKAPDFTLKATTGKNVRLSELKGKVVMVNFWASWCGPCRQEMPYLEKIYNTYKDKGFELLGVNIDALAEDRDNFLAQATISFPILDDSDNLVSEAFNVEAMPSTFFIDKDGNLAYLHKGYKPGEEDDYIIQIKKLLAQ